MSLACGDGAQGILGLDVFEFWALLIYWEEKDAIVEAWRDEIDCIWELQKLQEESQNVSW